MIYQIVYDQVSGWQPCSIKARVAPSAGPGPPLRERFEVTDSAQGNWLRTGKMRIENRRLLDRASVTFSVTPLPTLTSEDLLQCQGQYQLQVSCFLDLPSALPGMGVPAPLDIPVAGLCQIQLALPVEIETRMERLSDDEAVLVFARPQFHLPTGPELRRSAMESLRFQGQSPDLKIEPQPYQADWRVVRVTYQPGPGSRCLGLEIADPGPGRLAIDSGKACDVAVRPGRQADCAVPAPEPPHRRPGRRHGQRHARFS